MQRDADEVGVVAAVPAVAGPFAPLRDPNFKRFWLTGMLSNIGTWMQVITVPYALDHLTHSSAVVGVGAFFMFFPSVLAGPFAGSLADRYSRQRVLQVAYCVSMLAAALLGVLWSTGWASPVNIIVVVTIAAVAQGISVSTSRALVTQLVPHETMLGAVRLDILSFQSAKAVGPGLAGLVLGTLGPAIAFYANAASFVGIVIVLSVIHARPMTDAVQEGNVLAHFWEAVQYVRRHETLRACILLTLMFALLGQSVIQLVEPFTRRVLDVGPGSYGLLVAIYGIGALVGSLLTVYGGGWRRSQTTMVSGVLLFGAELGFALAPNYGAAIALGALLGMGWVISGVAIQTAIQANVDDAHRGRVLAIYFSAFFTGGPIGALICGIVGDLLGLRVAFVGSAALLGAFLVFASVRFRRFRGFDEEFQPGKTA